MTSSVCYSAALLVQGVHVECRLSTKAIQCRCAMVIHLYTLSDLMTHEPPMAVLYMRGDVSTHHKHMQPPPPTAVNQQFAVQTAQMIMRLHVCLAVCTYYA